VSEDKTTPEDLDSTRTFEQESGPPQRIGNFRILQKLGEGGMGVVYLAEQERPIRRRVALKLIKLGMDTAQVLSRFDSERQALAILNHPNVAKVFDAGTTEQGRPYFVMEYVAGIPITDYCDRNRLGNPDRLVLFVQVCEAIQHAHQKGVIHRDIKPSNVLVAVEDNKPVPKVIDFGVAKATSQRLTERTLYTEQGVLIGTPEYMSPEQAEHTGLDVDTRTDVYSLGVLLYELLVGALPHDPRKIREAGFREMQRILVEEDPPRPSARLGTLGDGVADVARHHRTDPGSLARQVRGDLDWITMRSLEKDRTRRYASASELGADIRRYLADEPVAARPPSATYRLGKFARKHKVGVAFATAIVVTIVVLGSSTVWQARIAQRRALQVQRQALQVRANSIMASASAVEDPLVKALLLDEIADVPEVKGRLNLGLEILNAALPLAVLRGHQGPVVGAAFSSDGSRVFTVSADRTAGIWNTDGTGEAVLLQLHEDELKTAAYSSDGTRLATVSADGTVRIWRTDGAGGPVVLGAHEVIEGQPDPWWAAFSPDDSRVVTTAPDGTARVWWTDDTGEPVILRGHEYGVHRAVFSPDGARVGTASRDGTARIWRTDGTGEPIVLRGHEVTRGRYAHSLAFSPDGSRVVTASLDGTRVWWADGTGEPVVLGGGMPISAFSPDGSRVVTGSWDGTAHVWDADGKGDPIVLRGHDAFLSDAHFTPDGAHVVTASKDGTARLWRAKTGESIAVFQHEGWVYGAVVSPDGTQIITTSADGTARVWQSGEGGEALIFRGHEDEIANVWFSPDGNRLLTASKDRTARVWRADGTGEPVVLRGHEDEVWRAAFSPDGSRVVTASLDGTARLWRADGTGEPVVLAHEDEVCCAAFSPDGSRVVTASLDGTARLWPLDRTREPIVLNHEAGLTGAAFSPDGSRVVTLSKDGKVRVWPADGTGEPIVQTCAGVAFWVGLEPAFSPHGTRVVAGYVDGTACVWRADGTDEPVVLRGHQSTVTTTAFSPDGSRVVTASADGTVRVWRADGTGEPFVFREHAGQTFYASFSPDGSQVVSTSLDATARVWRTDGTGETLVLRHEALGVWRAAFSPDGTRVITVPLDKTLGRTMRVWPITWPGLHKYLRENLNACLTPKQRERFLGESSSEAWDTYAACESRFGRVSERIGLESERRQ
jgi:WD40 repeat protein/serine/threonine protein kinase